jgi:hypothetical protein
VYAVRRYYIVHLLDVHIHYVRRRRDNERSHDVRSRTHMKCIIETPELSRTFACWHESKLLGSGTAPDSADLQFNVA